MSAASPAAGHSSAASFTTDSNEEFDDAVSHAASSFATPTDSKPDTPIPESRPETPRPAHDGNTAEATPKPPPQQEAAHEAAHEEQVPQVTESDLAKTTLLKPDSPVRKLDSEETTLSGATTNEAGVHTASSKDSASEGDAEAGAKAERKEDASEEQHTNGSAEKGSGAVVEHFAPSAATEEKSTEPQAEEASGDEKGGGEGKEVAATVEDDSNYISGVKLWVLSFGLFVATFVVALDNTIIATAIPRITVDFQSLNDVGWYGSSYLLTQTSLQPTFGKIYTYFSIKWTYILALCIFEVGSIVCATAQSSPTFIVGRAIAGVGASALFSGGMTIIGYSVPLRRRAFYIAVLSSTFGIASVVGPLLGGVFTDSPHLTWRFCFWINLPFGGLAIATVVLFFRPPIRKHSDLTLAQKIGKMDLPGAFILICAVVCLLLALQWGGTQYPWSDSKVWGCLLGFGLLTVGFISVQLWRKEDATIPLRVISKRAVAVGCSFSTLISMALYVHIFYLPFYFQAVQGTSAEGSGIRTIPYLVSITLVSIVVGGLITTFGPYTPFMWFGAAIFTVGAAMLHLLAVGDGPARWIGFQILTGIGAGASVQIPFISVQVVCDAQDMPIGNALTIFFNSLGGALSVSIAENIFSNKLLQRLEASVPPAVVALVSKAGATEVQKDTPAVFLAAVLAAYDDAVTTAFIVSIAAGGAAFLVTLFMPWGSVKGKKIEIGGGA